MVGNKNTQNKTEIPKDKRSTPEMERSRRRAALQRKKKQQRKRRCIIIGVEVVLVAILSVCAYVVHMMGLMNYEAVADDDIYIPSYQHKDTAELQEGYRNIAIIGVDSRDNSDIESDGNGDVLMVASINNKTNEIKLVSLYRDTYLKMAEGKEEYQKANYQMEVAGSVATMNMMNMNLDLDIKEYVVVNWAAVAKAIDILGGVDDVEITEDLLKIGQLDGYITSVVESTGIPGQQIKKPGVYTLTGTQAVAYCRIRYVGSDYGRTQRQREIIGKMLEKAKSNIGLLPKLVTTIFPSISTNLDMVEILNLTTDVASYTITDQAGFPFDKYTGDNGYVGNIKIQDPVVPVDMEQNVIRLHQFLFTDESYMASDTVREISDYIKDISGVSGMNADGTYSFTTPVIADTKKANEN